MKIVKKLLRTPTLVLLILANIFALSSCDFIQKECTNHKWEFATCLHPAHCIYCGMYEPDGKLASHNFTEYDSGIIKCSECHILLSEYERQLNIETEDINFSEESQSSESDEALSDNTTNKKTFKVIDNHFNFTDDELRDCINNNSTAYVYNTELDGFDVSQTAYKVVSNDGMTNGILVLNHVNNKNDNIQAIMIYSDTDSFANAIGIWIGIAIDSNFDSDDAINALLLDEYYICGDMTIMRLDLDDETEVCLLAPSEYVADLLS